eukprot:3380804-Prymnesium_polylepis.1
MCIRDSRWMSVETNRHRVGLAKSRPHIVATYDERAVHDDQRVARLQARLRRGEAGRDVRESHRLVDPKAKALPSGARQRSLSRLEHADCSRGRGEEPRADHF